MENLIEKTVEELEARQAEIAGMETEGASTDEIEERANELQTIKEELEARKRDAEEAEEIRKKVAEGMGDTKEEHKEEKKMEVSEIRNSPEYLEAYANYIRSGNDNECRTVLLTKNAPASGQLPVPDMVESTIKTAWEKNEFPTRSARPTSAAISAFRLN